MWIVPVASFDEIKGLSENSIISILRFKHAVLLWLLNVLNDFLGCSVD